MLVRPRFPLAFLVPLLAILAALIPPGAPVHAEVPSVRVAPGQPWLLDERGTPWFLLGANYEGPVDRAWAMWDEGKFDPGLIGQDFQRARSVGVNALRIFVPASLAADADRGNFTKLDTVVALAKRAGLYLLITLYDYAGTDLEKVARTNGQLARHFANEPTVVGFDLKNEPRFFHLAGSRYPAGATVPVQQNALLDAYGPPLSSSEVTAWRQTAEGREVAFMTAEQAFRYANYYQLWKKFLDDAASWADQHPGKLIYDYFDAPEAAGWQGLLDGVSASLGAWIDVLASPIREASPRYLVTVGYNRMDLAKLSANRKLSYLSLHRYPAQSASSLRFYLRTVDNIQATFPDQPVVLQEFGYSNQTGAASDSAVVSPAVTASYEGALWLYLFSGRYAGGFKWMLNNFSAGYNARENNFGLFFDDGRAKPAAAAPRALEEISRYGPAGSGQRISVQADGEGLSYRLEGAWGAVAAGQQVDGPRLSFVSSQPAVVFAYRAPGSDSDLRVLSTTDAAVTIRPTGFLSGTILRPPVLDGVSGQAAGMGATWADGAFSFAARSGQAYTVRLSLRPPAAERAAALGGGDSTYFPQTGHNLSKGFRSYWQAHGGLAIFGFPLTEEFQEGGYTVQYFERARFEYHPEHQGTPYEVELGLLGRNATAGRPLAQAEAGPNTADRLYFSQTGHSLAFGFKTYWERAGGLAVFGFPISEEIEETNPADGQRYTVQYFERARFEYHPEHRGTPYEVELGLLGWQLLRDRGWMGQ